MKSSDPLSKPRNAQVLACGVRFGILRLGLVGPVERAERRQQSILSCGSGAERWGWLYD